MDPLIVVLAVAAIAMAAGLGWFLGSRPVAALRSTLVERDKDIADWQARHGERDGEAKAVEARFATAIAELGEARIENATLKANAENFDKQMAAMAQASEVMLAQFKATGAEVLDKAQEQFLKTASERFGHAERVNEEKLTALLKPVGDRLKSYEDQVGELERQRTSAFAGLHSEIEQMRKGNERVSQEAARLVNSLRNAPKARGRWGEQQLRNVLESCGLAEHTDFVTERSVETEEGRLRPDAVVRVPGGRALVIDAKVSLNDYQDAFNADDEAGRNAALDRHFASMKAHIEGLSRKAYWDQFDEAPDYVIMFVPGEHFLTAALEHEPRLWDIAFDKRVLLATPTNLIAIARTVAAVWRQEKMAEEANHIGALGKEMYDRLATVAESLGKTGMHLDRAVKSYNASMNSFNSRLVVTGRKFADLNIETGKRDLDPVDLLESSPSHTSDLAEPDAPLLVDDSDEEIAAE
ncbi:MAG: DNA recombination protein RmuC [Erythrobacter sp.]|nr:DNA recombination protein RmuC [Erythrobacter sp.]